MSSHREVTVVHFLLGPVAVYISNWIFVTIEVVHFITKADLVAYLGNGSSLTLSWCVLKRGFKLRFGAIQKSG